MEFVAAARAVSKHLPDNPIHLIAATGRTVVFHEQMQVLFLGVGAGGNLVGSFRAPLALDGELALALTLHRA
jgi:hypothetical protein